MCKEGSQPWNPVKRIENASFHHQVDKGKNVVVVDVVEANEPP